MLEFQGLSLFDTLALVTIMIFGVPHGAIDLTLAKRAGFVSSPSRTFIFLAGYSGLALFFIAFWYVFPIIGLILFLTISAFHFGRADAVHFGAPYDAFFYGAFPLIFIPLAHPSDVENLFSILTNREISAHVYFRVLGGIWLLFFLLRAAQARIPSEALVNMLVLTTSFILFSALWGFTIYFCFFHSRRHFIRVWNEVRLTRWRDWRDSVFLALITTIFIVIIASAENQPQFEISLLRALFIAIFALTIPHIIIIDGLNIFSRFSGLKGRYEKK